MFCQKCGAQQNDGMKFCGRCGAQMGAVSGFVGEPVTMIQTAAPKDAPASVSEGTPQGADSISSFPADRVWGRFRNIRNFLSLEGRSTRGEYWVTYLTIAMPLYMLAQIMAHTGIVFYMRGLPLEPVMGLGGLFLILSHLMFFPVVARRLHDLGVTAWVGFAMVSLMMLSDVWWWVVLLSVVPLIALGCIPGKRTPNRYGESPLAANPPVANTTTERVTWIWLSLLLLAFTHVSIATLAENWFFRPRLEKISKQLEILFDRSVRLKRAGDLELLFDSKSLRKLR